MHRPVAICIFLFCLAATLISCEDCGPTDEPLLTLNIQSQSTFRIDTLYGIGATGKLPGKFTDSLSKRYDYFMLPLNLNADSTRYRLRIDGREETITVFYQRKFYYKSQQCGYVFDLLPPVGDVSRQARTTRGRVVSVNYTQNLYDGGFLKSSTETGVQLSVEL